MATLVTTAPSRPTTGLKGLIIRYPLVAFFVLAFGLTWPYLIADALGSWGLLPFRLPLVLWIPMGYGPTFAALIVTGATSGKAGIHALLRRLLVWRVGAPWYALAIGGLVIPSAITLGLYTLLGGHAPLPAFSLGLILQLLVLLLVHGLINGEELGWRGYALPRLQAQRSALAASLILGAIWALFHLPLFFTQGNAFTSTPPLSFLLSTMAMSVLFTWIFNNTRGSVLLASLLHAAANTWPEIFHPDRAGSALYAWLGCGVICLVALIVVVVYGPARLTRMQAADGLVDGAVEGA
jgi:membrane protease YdiL (CAAX protease family)